MSSLTWPRVFALAVLIQVGLPLSAGAQTVAVDPALLEQLQQVIQQQQEQLQQQSEQLGAQAATIDALKSRVDQLEQKSAATETAAAEARSTAERAIDTAERSGTGQAPPQVIASTQEKIKLAISGQLNRATNIADDGEKTRAYFVDNDVSNSRVRFVGTGQVTQETTLGTTVEVAFSPNNSFDVSQDDEQADDFIDVRKVEGLARNDRFGQLLFGKGSAAADDTAEYDLSLVAGPIMYSGVSDIVGGLEFIDDGDRTGVSVGDAFFNFDGNRQDRVRYDSPVFGPGVQLAVSAGSDQRYDAALTWGGDYGDWTGVEIADFTTLGAISIREPNDDGVRWRLAGSFSTLHNPTGLSLTVAGGMDARSRGDDPYNLYGKLGWDTSFVQVGPTGFGVDFTYGENVSAEGDEGISVGLAAVQLLENFGTELYAQIRLFDLDRNNENSVEDIVVGTVGTRIKF